jgi:hypothetical protein
MSSNNITLETYLEIQKCKKMIDITMWAYGYSKPLLEKQVIHKCDVLMNKYEKCINDINKNRKKE